MCARARAAAARGTRLPVRRQRRACARRLAAALSSMSPGRPPEATGTRRSLAALGVVLLALLAACQQRSGSTAGDAPLRLLNVSYDPTRELYVAYNAAFSRYWKGRTG